MCFKFLVFGKKSETQKLGLKEGDKRWLLSHTDFKDQELDRCQSWKLLKGSNPLTELVIWQIHLVTCDLKIKDWCHWSLTNHRSWDKQLVYFFEKDVCLVQEWLSKGWNVQKSICIILSSRNRMIWKINLQPEWM